MAMLSPRLPERHPETSFDSRVRRSWHHSSSPSKSMKPYLVINGGLGDQNVGNIELVDIAMPLELLSYPCAEGGDG